MSDVSALCLAVCALRVGAPGAAASAVASTVTRQAAATTSARAGAAGAGALPADNHLALCKVLANLAQGAVVQVVRDLPVMRARRDLEAAAAYLTCVLAPVCAHSGSELRRTGTLGPVLAPGFRTHVDWDKIVLSDSDRETLNSDGAPAALDAVVERAGVGALYLAAFAAFMLGDTGFAQEYVDRALGANNMHTGSLVLAGWLAATTGMQTRGLAAAWVTPASVSNVVERRDADWASIDAALARAVSHFESVMASLGGLKSATSPHAMMCGIEARMGLACVYERRAQYSEAVDILADILATQTWFIPAASEQARLLTKQGEWDMAADAVTRVLEVDATNTDCLRLSCLHALLREGASLHAVSRLTDLFSAVQKQEPAFARIYYDISRVFAQLAGRAKAIISGTLAFLDAAVKIAPHMSVLFAEMGYQRLLLGDTSGAMAAYNDAARVDDGNDFAISGGIACQIAQGQINDAHAQMPMYRLITETLGSSMESILLEATLAWRKVGSRASQLEHLHNAAALWSRARGLPVLRASESASQAERYFHMDASSKDVLGSASAFGGAGSLLPLPALRPGSDAELYDFYYGLSPETALSLARLLLINTLPEPRPASSSSSTAHAPGGAAAGGGVYEANLAYLLGCTVFPDVRSALPSGLSAPAALATLSAEGSAHPPALTPAMLATSLQVLLLCAQPASVLAWLQIAAVHAACESWDVAVNAARRALEINPALPDAHLLLAHIGVQRGDLALASGALESALSHSFSMYDNPQFLVLQASVSMAQRNYETTISTCEAALKAMHSRAPLPGVRGAPVPSASLRDRATAFRLLAQAQLACDRVTEAERTIGDALQECAGTSEEGSLIVVQASLALQRGDSDTALALLNAIPASNAAFTQAVAKKADIFFHHRRDHRRYVQCYQDLVDIARTDTNLCALGEAYMRVQMPERAIESYEAARALRPNNSSLVCKIGRALSLMHDYEAAVAHYEAALASEQVAAMSAADRALVRSDLTELLVKLKRFDAAQDSIRTALAEAYGSGTLSAAGDASAAMSTANDIVTLRVARKNLQLLAKVQKMAKDMLGAAKSLEQALEVQQRALSLARRDPSAAATGLSLLRSFGAGPSATYAYLSTVDQERVETSSLCQELGLFYERDFVPPSDEKARSFYAQASHYVADLPPPPAPSPRALPSPAASPSSPTTGMRVRGGFTVAGATLAGGATVGAAAASAAGGAGSVAGSSGGGGGSGGGAAEAERASPLEETLLSLARLHLRRGEVPECRKVCNDIVAANAACEEANLILADLLFRENDTVAATYHFRTLLSEKPNNYEALARFIVLSKRAGQLPEAAKFLKAATRAVPSAEVNDTGFKYCKGIYHRFNNEPNDAIKMLNSVRLSGQWGVRATEHIIGIYLSPDNDPLWLQRDDESNVSPEELASALNVCNILLRDIPDSARTAVHDVLACYILMASRSRASIEEAAARLNGILDRDPDFIPALQALATALMLQKQGSKARNLLKRLFKLPFDADYADDLLKAHLLLADVHIESSKFDQASEELKAALDLDASNARAYEYLGAIAEREVRYADAADMYEKAWHFENEASAPVGYKLAYNYMKAGAHVRAIDVCHKVLKLYPDYPRLRPEVLDKARAMLRS